MLLDDLPGLPHSTHELVAGPVAFKELLASANLVLVDLSNLFAKGLVQVGVPEEVGSIIIGPVIFTAIASEGILELFSIR